jgi:hypothetical protein
VSSILASVLAGGGWGLVVGWLLPTALNVGLFTWLVLPSLRDVPAFHTLAVANAPLRSVVILAATVLGGLLLSALQGQLYRVLEGYLGWPGSLQRSRRRHHQERKAALARSARLAKLTRLEAVSGKVLNPRQIAVLNTLRDELPQEAEAMRTHPPAAWQVTQLSDRLDRYPPDDDQVMPTRLGNALRSMETYGHDRYRIDAVVLWYALAAVSPKQIRKQEAASRAVVDFFVCMLYAGALLVLASLGAIAADPRHFVQPLVTALLAAALLPGWYWAAVVNIDDWAGAVRAMVDVGRKPLAKSLGLAIPASLDEERRMWQMVSRQASRPYRDGDATINQYRTRSAVPPAVSAGLGGAQGAEQVGAG